VLADDAVLRGETQDAEDLDGFMREQQAEQAGDFTRRGDDFADRQPDPLAVAWRARCRTGS
jgi:hypothetical protein